MNRVRIGIVGTGLIWHNVHKEHLEKRRDFFQIYGFCGRSIDKARVEAAKYNAKCYNSYGEMLKDTNIDAVLILTPPSLNGPYTLKALDAGKIVFVEKPTSVKTDEAEEIARKEKETGNRVFTLEQLVYSPQLLKAKEIINSGSIGKPVSYDKASYFYIGQDVSLNGYEKCEWRCNPDFPLGTLFDGGVHDVATITFLFGPPVKVYSLGDKLREDYGDYDQVMTLAEHKNVKGNFAHSGFLGCSFNFFYVRCTEGTLSIGDKIVVEKKNGAKDIIEFDSSNLHDIMWDSFIDCIKNNKAPVYTASDASESIKMLNAIDASLKSNKPVCVE